MPLPVITADDLELSKQILAVSHRQITGLQQRISTEKSRVYSSYGKSVIEMCQQQLNCAQAIFIHERNSYDQLQRRYHAQFQHHQMQMNENINTPKTQQKQTNYNNVFPETPPIPIYMPATSTPSATTLNVNISRNKEPSQVTWLPSSFNSSAHSHRSSNINSLPLTPISPLSTNKNKFKPNTPNIPKTNIGEITNSKPTHSESPNTNQTQNEFAIGSKKEESIETFDAHSINNNVLNSQSSTFAAALSPIDLSESFSRQESNSFLPRKQSVKKTNNGNITPIEVANNGPQEFGPLATAFTPIIDPEQKEIDPLQSQLAVTPIIGDGDEKDSTVIEGIDKALGAYYESMRGEDSNYYRDDNEAENGLFAEWCDENGYDDDGVADELGINADPLECAVTDFTDDFPFNTNVILNKEQEKLEMFKILQHCYKFGFDARIKYGNDALTHLSVTNIFLKKYLYQDKVFEIDYDLSQNDLDQTQRIYMSQCDGVFGQKILTDHSFGYGLAIGIKNNYFPFMQYLLDIYVRHCLQFVLKDMDTNKRKVEFKDFLRKRTKIYDIISKQKVQELIGAIDIYSRLCPTMHITKPLTIINDNICDIIQYLIVANDIIQHIINQHNNNENIQFQFDMTIACNSVHSTQKMCQPVFDDDEDEEDEEEEEEVVVNPYQDVLGNVHRKLNENKLKNISVSLSAIRKPENMDKFEEIDELDRNKLIDLCSEIFNLSVQDIDDLNYNLKIRNEGFENNNFLQLCDVFSKFRLLSLQKALDGIYKDLDISDVVLFTIIDFELDCTEIKDGLSKMLDINGNKKHFEENHKDILNAYKKFACLYQENDERNERDIYPQKHRINMFVDRRSNNYENKEKHNYFDDIIFYECPMGANKLPLTGKNEIVSESFFNLTQKCVIPRIGYVDGMNEAILTMHMNPKERLRNSTISGRTAPGGNVLIFSFHILSKDIIKCYLFRDAQITRFLPQDIQHILSHLFNGDYNANNTFYNNDKEIYHIISQLTYSDKLFNSWFNNRAKNV